MTIPILILHGSQQPYISLGVRFGGVRIHGKEYTYLPLEDAFLRKEYVRKYTKHKKEGGNFQTFIEYLKTIKQ